MGPSTAYGPQLPIDGCCSPEFASELERWRRFRGGKGLRRYATSTPGMRPLQPLELVRGFAAAVQQPDPYLSGSRPAIAIRETRLSTQTYTRGTPRLSGGIYDPNRTSFELDLNSEMAIWLASASRRTYSGRSADARGRRADTPTVATRARARQPDVKEAAYQFPPLRRNPSAEGVKPTPRLSGG